MLILYLKKFFSVFVICQIYSYLIRLIQSSFLFRRKLFNFFLFILLFFSAEHFNLLNRNCNTFPQNMSKFLCGINIPEHIFDVAIGGDRDAFPDLSSLSKIIFRTIFSHDFRFNFSGKWINVLFLRYIKH